MDIVINLIKDELIKDKGITNPIKIGNDVYIATRSSVIKGDIGDGCIISAHSLLIKILNLSQLLEVYQQSL